MDNKFVGPGGAKVGGGGADTDKLNIDSIIARLLEGNFFCSSQCTLLFEITCPIKICLEGGNVFFM